MAVPTLVVSFSTDPADDPTPSWTDVTVDVRSFSISRGRESELGTVDAGTAEIVLSNRAGDYDPTLHAAVGPMNRWKIETVLSGPTTEVLFLGYAEAYVQQWPATGMDALVTVQLADEFKRLALDRLPTTDPPRNTYQDLVTFDEPVAFWPMTTDSTQLSQAAVIGPVLQAPNGIGTVQGAATTPPIGIEPSFYISFIQTEYLRSQDIEPVDSSGLDPGALTELTYELWWSYGAATGSGVPSSQEWVFRGPSTNGGTSWGLQLDTDGSLTATVRNSSATSFVNDSAVLTEDTWYHIVCTITAGTFRLYINGTQVDSVAFTGAFSAVTTPAVLTIGNLGSTIGGDRYRNYNNVAFYRYGLTADRVTAHYNAGVNRGFARSDLPGDRADDVLTASDSIAASNTRTGSRTMTGSYMVGQSPLDELRKCEQADAVDAVLFIARDGTITFLDDGHRSVSPWDTVQATFDDDGTDIPYQEIDVDESDAFIANEWNVTKTGGTTITETDATSVGAYGKRSQSLTDLPITSQSDVQTIADDMLAKYKDPMTRITGLTILTKTTTVSDTVLPLEIGDRIRVFRTRYHNGGGRIDQTLFVQKIEIAGTPGTPWRIRLGVSPL